MGMDLKKQEEDIIREVFGSQKVRLYKIKHFIFGRIRIHISNHR